MSNLNPIHPHSPASGIQAAATVPMFRGIATPSDSVRFSGNPPETPGEKSFMDGIKQWFRNLFKWLNPEYALKRIIGYFQKRKANTVLKDLAALTPEKIREVMAEPPLDKIDYREFAYPSTGVAKAKEVFGPQHPTMKKYQDWTFTNVYKDYGVNWNPFRTARDTLQNFFDGQGQTLDGVDIEVKDLPGGEYQVRIKASANYDAYNLLGFGAGTKSGNKRNAGKNGEGLKVVALVLLRDYGADRVTYRSREWQGEFKLDYPGQADARNKDDKGVMLKLTHLDPPFEGNDVSFTIKDAELAKYFKKYGRSMFYNPKNPIFTNPTYENEHGGFKLLPEAEASGRVYEAGQLREFGNSGHFDAIPGLVLWSNERVIEPENDNRDRPPLQPSEVSRILNRVVSGMSLEETVQGIRFLRSHWFYQKPEDLVNENFKGDDKKGAEMLLEAFCKHYADLARNNPQLKGEKPDFLPEGLVAVPSYQFQNQEGLERLKKLYSDGYIPVKPALTDLGVPDGEALLASEELLLEEKSAKVEPTPRQIRQTKVLRDTLESLSDIMMSKANAESGSFKREYLARKAGRITELAQLPVQIVSLPEGEKKEPFIKLSHDEHRLLVDQRVLDGDSFPEAVARLYSIVQRETFIDTDTQIRWFFEKLSQLEASQAAWNQQE